MGRLIYDEANIINCTVNRANGSIIPSDTTFNLIITANEGFKLDGNIQYKVGNVTRYENRFTDNDTKCTIKISTSNNVTILSAKAVPNEKPSSISEFVNIYKVDNDILNKISQERFIDFEGKNIDIGTYIISLYELPFNIDTSIIGSLNKVKFGNYVSTVDANIILKQVYEIDLGSITIPEKYRNAYDYINTECILRIPFFNTINLPIEYVINNTLSFKFIIDLYNGMCTLSISSSFNNNVIYNEAQYISNLIPFMNNYNTIRNNYSSRYFNSLDKVSVEIIRNVPYYSEEMNNKLGKPVIKYDTLNVYKGYISVSDLDITSDNATNNEILEIESLLEDGITIL